MAAAAAAGGGEEFLLKAHLSDEEKRLAVSLARRILALVMQAVREELSRTLGCALHPSRQHMLHGAVLVALHELSGRQVSTVLGRKRNRQTEQAEQQQQAQQQKLQQHIHHHPKQQPPLPPPPQPQQRQRQQQRQQQQQQQGDHEQPVLQLPVAPAWQQNGGKGAVDGSWQPAEVIQQPADCMWQPADVNQQPAEGGWSPTAAAPPGSELPPPLPAGGGSQGGACPRHEGAGGQGGACPVQGGGSGAEDPLTLLQALLELAGLMAGGTELLQLPSPQPAAKRCKAGP